MKKSRRYVVLMFWWLAVLAAGLIGGGQVFAQDRDIQQITLDIVNEIRLDPLGYAESRGFDRQALLSAHAWLGELIAQGMPQVAADDYLSARAATQGESPEQTPWQEPAVSGEVSGSVSFPNFISPGDAVRIFLNYRFERELGTDFTGRRLLLCADLENVGMALYADSESSLSYNITICFGSSDKKANVQMMNMVNQLRADPGHTAIVFSLETLAAAPPCPPVFRNSSLADVAGQSLGLDRAGLASMAAELGYSGQIVEEATLMQPLAKNNDNLQVLIGFMSLVNQEVSAGSEKELLLNQQVDELGIFFSLYDMAESDYLQLGMVGGGTAAIDDTESSKIYGVVYSDPDFNEFYTPGEGVADRKVSFFRKDTQEKITTVLTNNAGQFEISLPYGLEYTMITGDPENWSGKDFYLGIDDLYVDLIYRQDG